MSERVCPVWIGYLLSSPLRKWLHDPVKILSPYVEEGMKVVDIGSAMGYFSLPLAHLTGPHGKTYCVDLQGKMLAHLKKRASKTGLCERMEMRLCSQHSLELQDLDGQIDFALAFAMVHEVPSPERLFQECYSLLKPGGQLLLAEPRGHVSSQDYAKTLSLAQAQGFYAAGTPAIRRCHAHLLQKRR